MPLSPLEWPTYQVDTANTGYHPTATRPDEPVEPLWRRDSEFPWSTAPLLVDGTLYAGTDTGSLHAIDPETGQDRWQFQSPEYVTGVLVRDGRVYVGNSGPPKFPIDGSMVGGRAGETDALHVLDAETGAQLDSRFVEEGVATALSARDGSLFLASGDENVETPGAVHRVDSRTLEYEWTVSFDGLVGPPPALAGDSVFVGTDCNRVIALDAATGDRRWTTQCGTEADRGIRGDDVEALVATEELVVVRSDRTVIGLDATTGDERWRADGRFLSHLALADDTVYVDSLFDTPLHALNLETGEVRWTCDSPDTVKAPPTIVDGRVYVGTTGGEVRIVETDTGDLVRVYEFSLPPEADPDEVIRGVSNPVTVVDGRIYADDSARLYALCER